MTNAHPVAFYLNDLSGDSPRRGGKGAGAFGREASLDTEAQIVDANARGILEGRAAAQVEHDEALAKQAAMFEQKLASERQKWTAEQGARLGEMIVTFVDDLELRISEQIGRILTPVLGEEIRAKAVTQLAQSLNGMLSKGEYAKVTVSGPQDLLSALEAQIGIRLPALTLVAAEGCDLSVSADTTILETRIAAWIETIRETSP